MLKTTLKITALSVVSLTLLTACGLASKIEDELDKVEDDIDNETDKVQDELDRLARLARPTPPSSPVVAVADRVVSYHNATVTSTNTETQDTFSVRAGTTTDTLIMTVNGVEYPLTKDTGSFNRDAFRATGITSLSDNNPNSPAIIADIEDVVAGTHATVQGMFVRYRIDANDPNARGLNFTGSPNGYATIGTRTDASAVTSQTATATYNGTMQLLTVPTTGPVRPPNKGDLAMTVDFDANTVSGTGTVSLSGGAGIVTFGSAPIVGNGFAGTFTMNDVLRGDMSITDNPTGNYAGNFFGSAADDIAGVMRFEAQSGAIGIGGFRGDRQ